MQAVDAEGRALSGFQERCRRLPVGESEDLDGGMAALTFL